MLGDKMQKRMVSSIFIILAPPQKGCGGPAKAPLFLPTEKPVPHQEGRGPSAAPGAGSVALPSSVDPPQPVEASLGSLQPDALRVETLGPDLQTGAVALPSSLQTSEVEETLGWTDGRAEEVEEEEAAAPGICAFCHKGILPEAPALEAMRKQYHVKCFTCRGCHSSLAGQSYYQKEGRPLCVACYQKTLEKCDACQAVILSEIVWAAGKGYHPECFTCVACSQPIGSDAFAVDDDQRALCLPDFYRRFASVCGVCEEPIIPQDGRDAYRIECLGRSFHEDCYRCEVGLGTWAERRGGRFGGRMPEHRSEHCRLTSFP
ncbi:PREDICTED: filamin-binding LIM protein 1 [Thamnophis sirtalis]|uniref:Filamin-binding LIM protein 1 n=1 Tax=Thamnophis sirtalis TaxID=35019 RepID=A0A6I9Y746_9SAUR|nr:PREDICTED: filamin-binding LIM protein 1 [Thamnophis sirtalis]